MNCGSSERYRTAIFGLSRLVAKPMREQAPRRVMRQVSHLKRRPPAGTHRLPGEINQIERAADPQRIIGIRHGQQQRGDAESRRQHIDEKAERDPDERGQPRHRPLTERARNQVDHVRAGCQHHAERNKGEGCKGWLLRA